MHGIHCLCEQTGNVDNSHYNICLSHHKLIMNFNLFQPQFFLNTLTDFIMGRGKLRFMSTTAIQILRIIYVSFGNTHNS